MAGSGTIAELYGPSEPFIDMFGTEFPQYPQSQVYFITNVGDQRALYLQMLRGNGIEVLEEVSSFKYIKVRLAPDQVELVRGLMKPHDSDVMQDAG